MFNGSYARQTRMLCATETFSCYTFVTPDMTVLVNGKKGSYGHLSAYARGKYPNEELRNHYAWCYGGDYARVEYLNQNSENGTLLVIGSSYTNAINPLIASHFSRTIFIDPRYWADWAGEDFDPAAFCESEGVDRVLYLADVAMFLTDEAQKGGDS